jgi:hypothetical protein
VLSGAAASDAGGTTSRPPASEWCGCQHARICGADGGGLALAIAGLGAGCEQRGDDGTQRQRTEPLPPHHNATTPDYSGTAAVGQRRPNMCWNCKPGMLEFENRLRQDRIAGLDLGQRPAQDVQMLILQDRFRSLDLMSRHAVRASHPDAQVHRAHADQNIAAGFNRGRNLFPRIQAPVAHNPHACSPLPQLLDSGSVWPDQGICKVHVRQTNLFSIRVEKWKTQRAFFGRNFATLSLTRRTSVFIRTCYSVIRSS